MFEIFELEWFVYSLKLDNNVIQDIVSKDLHKSFKRFFHTLLRVRIIVEWH